MIQFDNELGQMLDPLSPNAGMVIPVRMELGGTDMQTNRGLRLLNMSKLRKVLALVLKIGQVEIRRVLLHFFHFILFIHTCFPFLPA